MQRTSIRTPNPPLFLRFGIGLSCSNALNPLDRVERALRNGLMLVLSRFLFPGAFIPGQLRGLGTWWNLEAFLPMGRVFYWGLYTRMQV